MFCRKDGASRGLPLRHPARPRAAALSASFAPGAQGPRLRVTREAYAPRSQTSAQKLRTLCGLLGLPDAEADERAPDRAVNEAEVP